MKLILPDWLHSFLMAAIFFLDLDKSENHLVSTSSTVRWVSGFIPLTMLVISCHASLLSLWVRLGLNLPFRMSCLSLMMFTKRSVSSWDQFGFLLFLVSLMSAAAISTCVVMRECAYCVFGNLYGAPREPRAHEQYNVYKHDVTCTMRICSRITVVG